MLSVDSFCCIETILLIFLKVLFEVDAHLCLHDSQAATDDAFVIDLFYLETERRLFFHESTVS